MSSTTLRVGDVLDVQYGPMVVDLVNESRARARSVFPGDKHAANLSLEVSDHLVLARLGESFRRTLPAWVSANTVRPERQEPTNEKDDSMPRKKTTSSEPTRKPRSRRKATVPPAAEAAPEGKSSGRLGGIHGASVTSSIRRLAAEGCSNARITAIMQSLGVDVKPGTVLINGSLGRGSSKSSAALGKAEWSKEQLEQIMSRAGEPEA